VRSAGTGPAESQPRHVVAHSAVDEFGGSAQLVGDPMHRCDVDPSAAKSTYSTIESHA
jgi:hypothetical protein